MVEKCSKIPVICIKNEEKQWQKKTLKIKVICKKSVGKID